MTIEKIAKQYALVDWDESGYKVICVLNSKDDADELIDEVRDYEKTRPPVDTDNLVSSWEKYQIDIKSWEDNHPLKDLIRPSAYLMLEVEEVFVVRKI